MVDLDPQVYFSDNYLVLDVETDTSAGPEFYGHARHPENHLLLACWKHAFNLDITSVWGSEIDSGHDAMLNVISNADFIVAHNAKYELGWLLRMGVELRDVLVFDTKLAEYVLLGNLAAGNADLGMPRRDTSLDMCCRRRGLPVKDPVVDTLIRNGVNPVEIPRPWLQGRCQQDVYTTEQVFLSQRHQLQRRGLLPVQFTRCLLTPVLAQIEQEGLAIDGEAVATEHAKYLARQAQLQAECDEMTGGINIRSPLQMGTFLYETLGFAELADKRGKPKRNAPTKAFPGGAPLTDQKSLEKLKATTAKQRKFLELRKELGKVNAMLSKNLDFFKAVADQYEGRFFGEISQTSTATHRTASKGVPVKFNDEERLVQFQNFPRILKKLIKAKRPGWLFAEPDGSQIEFRCAAALGDDEVAIRDIKDPDFDAHVQTASVMYEMTKEAVLAEKKEAQATGRDDLRQLCKPDTYKPLYGGRFGTPVQEKYYKWFREHYCGIAKAQDTWVQEALDTKRQVTPWGLTYYWPTASRASNGSVNCETAVDNYPVQALATAEIVPIAAVYLWHRLRQHGIEDKVAFVNMVHDSIPAEVHPEAVSLFTDLVKQSFTADVYHYLKKVYGYSFDKVPLGVGLKIGERWGAGPEQSWDIYADGKEIQRK